MPMPVEWEGGSNLSLFFCHAYTARCCRLPCPILIPYLVTCVSFKLTGDLLISKS